MDISTHFVDLYKKGKELYSNNKAFKILSIASGITASITTLLAARYIYIKAKWKIKNAPPGFVGLPLIGGTLTVINLSWLENCSKIYGSCISTRFGASDTIIINDPIQAKYILSQPNTQDIHNTNTEDDKLSFLTSNGQGWRVRRRFVSSNLIRLMTSKFIENSTKQFIINKLFPEFDKLINNNKGIKFEKYFKPLGFNNVLLACFGKELNNFEDEFYVNYNKKMEKFKEMRQKMALFDIIFTFAPNFWRNKLAPLLFGEYHMEIIKRAIYDTEKYAINQENNIKNENNIELFGDFVKNYFKSKEFKKYKNLGITKVHLYGDMFFLLSAATDTTYSALSYICANLASNELIQNEIYNELINAFGNINEFTFKENGLLKIPKFRAFIHESLRLCSASFLAGFRILNKQGFKIKNDLDGKIYDIPKKCSIILNVHGISRNKKYWKICDDKIENDERMKNIDINKINLEFWLDKDGKFNKKRNGDSFATFGLGKRDCIGQALAIKAIYVVVALILMKYKVVEPKKWKIEMKLGQIPEPNIKEMKLVLREQ